MPFLAIVADKPLFKPCKPKPFILIICRATPSVDGVSFDLRKKKKQAQ